MGKRKMDSDFHRIKLDKGTVYQTSRGGNYYFRYQVTFFLAIVLLSACFQKEI